MELSGIWGWFGVGGGPDWDLRQFWVGGSGSDGDLGLCLELKGIQGRLGGGNGAEWDLGLVWGGES